MAVTNKTFNVFPYFAAGDTVTAYAATNWSAPLRDAPVGAPVGSSTSSGTVGSDGSLTLSLAYDTEYWLAANESGTYKYVHAYGPPSSAVASAKKSCQLWNSAAIPLSNNVDTYLTFNTVKTDNDGMFNAGSPDRITIQTDGVYIVSSVVAFQANTTGTRWCWMELTYNSNGTTTLPALDYRTANADGGVVTTIPLSWSHRFSAGDYLRIGVTQNSGGTLNVITSTEIPTISVTQIGS